LQKLSVSGNMASMKKIENETVDAPPPMEKMFEAGTHYGYSKSRRHPSMSPYIYATKNNSDIIDLAKTSLLLENACQFVRDLGARNKIMLFVGTKPEAKELVKVAAESLNMPYVTERWIGGTLSNFSEIKKRIAVLETYRKDSSEGGLKKYTKKERSVMAKEMERLAKYYSGLVGLKKTPEAVFIVDARKEHIAATEARKGNVSVIAVVNSDSDIKDIDYPIMGNDASIPSIRLFTDTIVQAYKKGQMSAPKKE